MPTVRSITITIGITIEKQNYPSTWDGVKVEPGGNRHQIHSGMIREAPVQVGVLRNTYLHRIFHQKKKNHIKIYRQLVLATLRSNNARQFGQ